MWFIGLILFFSAQINEPIQPLSPVKQLDPGKISLGFDLFNEPLLSSDNTISCASCHVLALGGVDRLPVSIGVAGRRGSINAPTVFNMQGHIAYFWDGRASTLEEQIEGPIHNSVEMNSDWPGIIKKLSALAEYKTRFAQLFPQQGISHQTIVRALSEFMLSLQTLSSPFDRWLMGDKNALSPEQLKGYQLFKSYGCIACHQGQNVGSNMFATMGIMDDYFSDRQKTIQTVDLGRYNITHREQDKFVFKVPSLRLVTLTPPYFHDASTDDLKEAIKIMAHYQLGRKIPDQDIDLIIAFLNSLVGQHPLLK